MSWRYTLDVEFRPSRISRRWKARRNERWIPNGHYRFLFNLEYDRLIHEIAARPMRRGWRK